LSIIEDTWC